MPGSFAIVLLRSTARRVAAFTATAYPSLAV
jgi:hypothetical protein